MNDATSAAPSCTGHGRLLDVTVGLACYLLAKLKKHNLKGPFDGKNAAQISKTFQEVGLSIYFLIEHFAVEGHNEPKIDYL